jgi:hypothetical protein
MPHRVTFTAILFRYPGKGGWHFAPVPAAKAPSVRHAWGRSPVRATVDGKSWATSVWWDSQSKRTLLAVPKRMRQEKGEGDRIRVILEFQSL